jgi:hypothetical protein
MSWSQFRKARIAASQTVYAYVSVERHLTLVLPQKNNLMLPLQISKLYH